MKKDISSRVGHPDQHWIDHGYDISELFVGKSSDCSYNIRCRKCGLGVASFTKFSKDSMILGVSTHISHYCKVTDKYINGWVSPAFKDINFIPM
jgi:hypothetical protein